jgi:long-chain acyl-CoA synthetase
VYARLEGDNMRKTVYTMLDNAVEDFGDHPFVAVKNDEEWQHYSFRTIASDAEAIAAALLSRGYRDDEKIAILAEGSAQWVTCEFGTLLAGGISVPLSIKLLPEEIPFRLNHSEARAIVVSKNMLPKLSSSIPHIERHDMDFIVIDENGASLEELRSLLPEGAGDRVFLFRSLLEEGRALLSDYREQIQAVRQRRGEDDIVTISYTSGTTGNPKGIMLTHRNYFTNCSDSVDMFRVPLKEYSTLIILPCDHSFAHSVGIYAALLRGITLYFVDARGGGMAILRNIPINLVETDPVFLLTVPSLTGNFMKKIRAGVREKGRLIEDLFEKGIACGTKLYGDGFRPPSIGRYLRHYPLYKLADLLVFRKVRSIFGRDLRFCVGGGALLDIKQQEFFNALGVPIYQGYGLTEAAPVISSNLPRRHKFGTSGVIAPSVTCRVVKEDGNVAAAGEQGEIAIRGENVMKGYYKNEEATRETIREGWLYTGDLGYMDEDGFLMVVGRAKALLISKDGEKYSPEGIEEAIVNSSEYISQVMLYNDHRPYTVALIVPDTEKLHSLVKKGNIKKASEMLDFLSGELYAFKHQESYRGSFPTVWLPTSFQVLTEPFSEENKMINSTMKMVRHKIAEACDDLIEYMYSDEGKQHHNEKNHQAVRTLLPDLD